MNLPGPTPVALSGRRVARLPSGLSPSVGAFATRGEGRTSSEDKEYSVEMEEARELDIEAVDGEELPEFALMVDVPD